VKEELAINIRPGVVGRKRVLRSFLRQPRPTGGGEKKISSDLVLVVFDRCIIARPILFSFPILIVFCVSLLLRLTFCRYYVQVQLSSGPFDRTRQLFMANWLLIVGKNETSAILAQA
jgi:hypothetical protein